jgi:hypothetical protein
VSVLRGDVLERAVQRDHFKFVWDGSRVRTVYSFASDVQYFRKICAGSPRSWRPSGHAPASPRHGGMCDGTALIGCSIAADQRCSRLRET